MSPAQQLKNLVKASQPSKVIVVSSQEDKEKVRLQLLERDKERASRILNSALALIEANYATVTEVVKQSWL